MFRCYKYKIKNAIFVWWSMLMDSWYVIHSMNNGIVKIDLFAIVLLRGRESRPKPMNHTIIDNLFWTDKWCSMNKYRTYLFYYVYSVFSGNVLFVDYTRLIAHFSQSRYQREWKEWVFLSKFLYSSISLIGSNIAFAKIFKFRPHKHIHMSQNTSISWVERTYGLFISFSTLFLIVIGSVWFFFFLFCTLLFLYAKMKKKEKINKIWNEFGSLFDKMNGRSHQMKYSTQF